MTTLLLQPGSGLANECDFFFKFPFKFPSVHPATKFMHVQAPSGTAAPFPNLRHFSVLYLTCTMGWWSRINSSAQIAKALGAFAGIFSEEGEGGGIFAKLKFCF